MKRPAKASKMITVLLKCAGDAQKVQTDKSLLSFINYLCVPFDWSYRGRNRIINPHLRSVSKQLKLQTNSYSECAPQDMYDYITGCSKLNGRMHVLKQFLLYKLITF